MCTEQRLTNSHTWELSCRSINILAANYGEGAQTSGRAAHIRARVCLCVLMAKQGYREGRQNRTNTKSFFKRPENEWSSRVFVGTTC